MVKIGDIITNPDSGAVTKVVKIEDGQAWGDWAENIEDFKKSRLRGHLQWSYIHQVKILTPPSLKEILEEL